MESEIENLLEILTLEEKISLLSCSTSSTTAIEAKGIPGVKISDKLYSFDEGTKSAYFPSGCSLASTFDPKIAYKVGTAIANEARSRGINCILGPNVCIQRHPTGERNFETFGEDPFLAGKLAAQVICGLQDGGVGAAIKSFVVNEESNVDATISERALREIYLRPFEIALKEASPLALIIGSNSINETPCYENGMLYDVLRRWSWEGLIMGDCAHSISALKAGLDLEMSGPTKTRTLSAVQEALYKEEITEHVIDDRVRAVLRFVTNVDALSRASRFHISSETEDRAFIRKAGAQGMVL